MQQRSETRKSSCINVRGIQPATYQVLHLLSYPWGGGGRYPIPGQWGYPISRRGIPHPWLGGTPSLARVPPIWTWLGYPSSAPGWGNPPPQEGTWDQSLGYPSVLRTRAVISRLTENVTQLLAYPLPLEMNSMCTFCLATTLVLF